MHDYHAVSALVAHLAAQPESGKVEEVRVRASPVFSPESLQQAYEMQTVETALEGSRLVVEEADDHRSCDACGAVWRLAREDVAGHLVVCPSCGTPAPIGEDVGLELLEVRTARPARARSVT